MLGKICRSVRFPLTALVLLPSLALTQSQVLDIRLDEVVIQPTAPTADEEVTIVYAGFASPGCLPTDQDVTLTQIDTFRFELRLAIEREACSGAGQPFRLAVSLGKLAAGSYTAQVSARWLVGGRQVNSISVTKLFQVVQVSTAVPIDIGSTVWFDVARSGQGVYLQQSADVIGGTWHFYDAEGSDDGIGQDTWLAFFGRLKGQTLTTDLLRFSGPALNEPWDQSQVEASVVGTLRLDVLTVDEVRFSYGVAGLSGNLNLIRFAPESVGQPYSKVWFVPLESGRGWYFLQNGEQLSGLWHYHDEFGQARWTIMLDGVLDQNNVARLKLFNFSGPDFAVTNWDINQVTATAVGSAVITFTSPDAAQFDYTLALSSGTVSGTKILEPFNAFLH